MQMFCDGLLFCQDKQACETRPAGWLQIAWWWKIEEQYASEMEGETEIFGGESGAKRKENLQTQVTEHNILVASSFYSQMHLERLATLLDLTQAQVCFQLFSHVQSHQTAAR